MDIREFSDFGYSEFERIRILADQALLHELRAPSLQLKGELILNKMKWDAPLINNTFVGKFGALNYKDQDRR